MARVDLTQKIMDRVIRLERHKTRVWLIRIIAVFSVLVFIFGLYLWSVFAKLILGESFYPLTLFLENTETIAENWRDTLGVFFAEFPRRDSLALALSLLAILVLFLMVRPKLPVLKRRIKSINAYLKRGGDNQ